MSTVWIGLGSNIGDRDAHIQHAVGALSGIISDIRLSSLYETGARDFTSQPDFLNAVLRGRTEIPPLDLLEEIHRIESAGGRRRDTAPEKGPRTIDIDILLYGGEVLSVSTREGEPLVIPHQSMDVRLFVLRPLLELDPHLEDPRDGISWAQKASHLSEQRVKLYR